MGLPFQGNPGVWMYLSHFIETCCIRIYFILPVDLLAGTFFSQPDPDEASTTMCGLNFAWSTTGSPDIPCLRKKRNVTPASFKASHVLKSFLVKAFRFCPRHYSQTSDRKPRLGTISSTQVRTRSNLTIASLKHSLTQSRFWTLDSLSKEFQVVIAPHLAVPKQLEFEIDTFEGKRKLNYT